MYSPSSEDISSEDSSSAERTANCHWFYCRGEPFAVHKSVSEASVYRTSSRFSLKSVSAGTKTLDYLMRCFWTCSTGCQQIS